MSFWETFCSIFYLAICWTSLAFSDFFSWTCLFFLHVWTLHELVCSRFISSLWSCNTVYVRRNDLLWLITYHSFLILRLAGYSRQNGCYIDIIKHCIAELCSKSAAEQQIMFKFSSVVTVTALLLLLSFHLSLRRGLSGTDSLLSSQDPTCGIIHVFFFVLFSNVLPKNISKQLSK